MGLRSPGHRFMPNRLVFPGGRVDSADHAAPIETPLDPSTKAALGLGACPATALAIAALRETEEEVGLTLRRPGGYRLAPLAFLCRVETPPDQPIRFDARFLALSWEPWMGVPAASVELLEPRFVPLAEAGSQSVPRPTRAALACLGEWLEGEPVTPWLVITWPGQVGRPGERTRPEPRAL